MVTVCGEEIEADDELMEERVRVLATVLAVQVGAVARPDPLPITNAHEDEEGRVMVGGKVTTIIPDEVRGSFRATTNT